MEKNSKKMNKVYGMLLEIGDTFFLSLQYASSLEEAFNQAKMEFVRLNPPIMKSGESLVSAKIGLFAFKDFKDMFHEHKVYDRKKLEKIISKHIIAEEKEQTEIKKSSKKVEVKKIELTQEDIKNMIMKEIISKKDKTMLDANIKLFSKHETQYLIDKIENKQNS